jgi:hypothetical protein
MRRLIRAQPYNGGLVTDFIQVHKDGSLVQYGDRPPQVVKPVGEDTVPSLLQKNELVVNKNNTKKVLKLIDEHNQESDDKIIIPGLEDSGIQESDGEVNFDKIEEFKRGGIVGKKKKQRVGKMEQTQIVNIFTGRAKQPKRRRAFDNRPPSYSEYRQVMRDTLNPLRIVGQPILTNDATTTIYKELLERKLAQLKKQEQGQQPKKVDSGAQTTPEPVETQRTQMSIGERLVSSKPLELDEQDLEALDIIDEEELISNPRSIFRRLLPPIPPYIPTLPPESVAPTEIANLQITAGSTTAVSSPIIGAGVNLGLEPIQERLEELEVTKEELEAQNLVDLKEQSKRAGIPGYSTKNKKELIDLMLKFYNR